MVARLVLVDGGQLLLGEHVLAQLAAALGGVKIVLALHIAAGLDEETLARLGQAFGQALAGFVGSAPGVGDALLEAAQPHLVEHATGQQSALAGKPDLGRAGALAGRLHGLGQGRGVMLQKHVSKIGLFALVQLAGQGFVGGRRSSGVPTNSSRLKKVSNRASNRAVSEADLASVEANASRNSSRSA